MTASILPFRSRRTDSRRLTPDQAELTAAHYDRLRLLHEHQRAQAARTAHQRRQLGLVVLLVAGVLLGVCLALLIATPWPSA